MKAIKLLAPIILLTSCVTSQMSYKTQEQIELKKAKQIEYLGLKEYTVITNDSTYRVVIPIDSSIAYDTFAKYFNNNKK